MTVRSDSQSEGGGEDELEAEAEGGAGAGDGEQQQDERVAGLKEWGEEDQAVSREGRSRGRRDHYLNMSLLQPTSGILLQQTSGSQLQPSQHIREGRCEDWKESRRKLDLEFDQ